ncbi:hypothetical protein PT015_20025 [Candidatus Mycobacterium wuenschmannii]|uniref:PLL-like beta propeller domain-containing protein n=1 Tax=Candidatus Mycobacterium wuenschmannii TaxID=3027808 RepID=A0ABY8VVU5_9MYCO|nr:hypothetical protein [Candidatus Mycobacterium wuenschmannii]WIM87130.1 hypothetical protein PT015_20025 [Candidatus Mycobacterium wuenschmannii]
MSTGEGVDVPEYGKAVVTQRDPFHLDVFMRSPADTLLHIWGRDGDADAFDNAMDLGGLLDSEPVAVKRHPAGMDVFALSMTVVGAHEGPKILHWSWAPGTGLWSGPEELPGFAATTPAVVADDDWLYVFARSVDGSILWWWKHGDRPWKERGVLVNGPRIAVGDPVVIRRAGGQIDIYYAARHPDVESGDLNDKRLKFVVDTVTRDANNHHSIKEHELVTGNRLKFTSTALTAFSRAATRQDIYVRSVDGKLIHWGFGGLDVVSETDQGWYGPEAIVDTTTFPLTLDPIAVNRIGQADIFVLDKGTSRLRRWNWNELAWAPADAGPATFRSNPAAISRNKDTIELVVRTGDYEVTVWKWAEGTPGSWSGPKVWTASLFKQDPPNDPLAGTADDAPPDFLIVRPQDHVVLGVTAPGHSVRLDAAPGPPTLQLPGGDVVLTFPPQHIAEQASRPGATAGGGIWAALLSGPSRLPIDEIRDPLITSSELLAAFDGHSIDAEDNAIELPRGLIIAPETAADQAAPVVRHPTNPIGSVGTYGIWRSRIESTGDGDLHIRALRAGRDENFTVALPKADRILIAELCDGVPTEKLPVAKRLELSCLGGTLTASGKWRTYEWDHNAVLGRDQTVRTAIKGVLYPFGHRAVWVEMTERSTDEDVAVLRKISTLYITEPVKHLGADAPNNLRNAFPFSEVEIGTREYRNLDNAVWKEIPRPSKAAGELQSDCEDLRHRLDRLRDEVFLGGAIGGVTTEALAQGTPAAVKYLQMYAQLQRFEALLALLDEQGIGTVGVKTFFTPFTKGRPLQFPIRCRAKNGDVHFPQELIFVADLDLNGDFRPLFRSLSDSRVTAAVFTEYERSGGGVIDLPSVPIDLLPHTPPTFADAPTELQTSIHEVRRLNIVGNHHLRGFLPTLGVPGDAKSWAAYVGMPTVRSLIGQDPTTKVLFTPEYLRDSDVDVPLKLMDQLVLDFTEIKDRAGGLAGPKLVVDRISRLNGLANTDPRSLIAEGASLLGFSLKDLLGAIDVPPELKTIVRDGVPNEVRMKWQTVPLQAVPMFKPGPDSTVTIDVVSSGLHNDTFCVANNFTLQIPSPGPDADATEALIEIDFKAITFRQNTGEAPKVSVDISDIRFVGRLHLLTSLQEAIGGFDKLPVKIEAAKDKVVARYQLPLPDVSAMSFVMSNLVFSAALTIPFTKDPVSIAVGFASRERPFTLTVLMFGGGGYVDLELDYTGLRRLEISLQFGAAIGMNFGVGKAEVHAFGGIRYALVSGSAMLTGYIHIGGSLDVLGLVSVSVELRVELAYNFKHNWLVGRATIVIDIDITLYSDSFELDSGEWVIAGGSGTHELSNSRPAQFIARPEPDPAGLKAWESYRSAFTGVPQA